MELGAVSGPVLGHSGQGRAGQGFCAGNKTRVTARAFLQEQCRRYLLTR